MILTEFEIPVPLDTSQCSGLNLTVPDFDDLHLELPKFKMPSTNETAIYVTCDLNVTQQLAAANGTVDSSTTVYHQRLCVARNNETDAKFNCHYDVRLTRKLPTQIAYLLA